MGLPSLPPLGLRMRVASGLIESQTGEARQGCVSRCPRRQGPQAVTTSTPGVQGPGPAQLGALAGIWHLAWVGAGPSGAHPGFWKAWPPGHRQARSTSAARPCSGPLPLPGWESAVLHGTGRGGLCDCGCSSTPLSSPVNTNTRGSRWDIAWLHSARGPVRSAPRPRPEGSPETSPAQDLGDIMEGRWWLRR